MNKILFLKKFKPIRKSKKVPLVQACTSMGSKNSIKAAGQQFAQEFIIFGNMSIISHALGFSPAVASHCISLILQGFSHLAPGLSCSMQPGQEQPGQAARIGGCYWGIFWEIVEVWGC